MSTHMHKINEGHDDGSIAPVPVPIRKDVIVLICNIPVDLTASEADKISRVICAMGSDT